MTIVRVLFPGLWETSWPKYVWFLKMNVYTLNSLHYSSNQQHLLRPRYSFVGRGVGGQRVVVWAKRQLTLQTTSGVEGGGCMSLWLYENWECLILAYMCDGGGYDCVTDIPTFSIPSPILAHQKSLTYLFHQGCSVPQKIVFQLVVWANSSHILLIWGHFLLVLINDLVRG